MRVDTEVLINKYKDHVFAAAFSVCRNPEDSDDIVQDTFIAYHTGNTQFQSEQHIRAWLIRVAINKAKDITRSMWRKRRASLDDYIETLYFETPEAENLFEQIMKLPEKYRIVIFLFYNEDYKVKEIADILKISESNVKTRLSRGRSMLKDILKEEWKDDEY